ncbi:sensor histidine kinase [Fulvivirgaceae bacterium BMA12]|uniref:histidine kinase n=1 Tax=Agaribacillus aureus TaxID=3051825 RepID=A0ABT8LHD1_9BACT|nr:sensor histidine kinase [Fulvivirgaceae bacterium BMA12]
MSKTKKIPLEGSWEFYWKQLLTPEDFRKADSPSPKTFAHIPGLWQEMATDDNDLNNIGYATYRIRVVTPPVRDLLGIKFPQFYSSSKIWIDSLLVSTCGEVGDSKNNTIHKRISETIFFKPNESGITEIIIQIANFYHKNGGINDPPVIGYLNVMLDDRKKSVIAETVLSSSLICMGLAFLFLYGHWRKDTAVLYFALFCLFWAYRGISQNYAPLVDMIPSLNWALNAKLEYVAMYLGSLAGSLYFNKIYAKNSHPKYSTVISLAIIAFMVVTLFSPDTVFTNYLIPFFMLMLLNLIYVIFIVVKSIIDKNASSVYAITGIFLGVIVFTLHMFVFYNQRDSFLIYIYLGYLGFFFLSATLLAVRFSHGFFKLEKLQLQTHEQKEELKTQADQLTEVNDQIVHQQQLLREKNLEIISINQNLENIVHERTSKLEKTHQELDTFLYRASHDLRRPISSILGIDQLARLTIKESGSLQLFEMINKIVRRMDVMLKKFICISEIYNHKLQFSDISMTTLEETIRHRVNYYAKKHKIINYRLDLQGPKSIHSDYFIIDTIVTHLIENSFMFSNKSDEEELVIDINFLDTGDLQQLFYSDNGPGISKDQLKNIFDMYFIGSLKSGGHGLGLYVVKKAAELLGEEIAVESDDHKGTTFHMILNKKG